jgi:outer membrane receptor protein involved in Fe transport
MSHKKTLNTRPIRRGPAALIFVVTVILAHFFLCPYELAAQENDEKRSVTELMIRGVPFASKKEDAPISVSVVTDERLQVKGETSFEYEIESIPNLTWSSGTSRPRFFLIRGVGELEQYEGAPNPSVATIIDGIDFSGLGVTIPLFDIEHVEVLRGPQGIMFGSSALAGALNINSNDPTSFTSGYVQGMLGNDDFRSGGFALGGTVPGLDERFQMRVSAFSSMSNGFRDNAFLGREDTNQRNESIVRLKARYQPHARLTVDVSAWQAEFDNGYDAFTIDNSFTTQSDRPGVDRTFVQAGTVKVQSALGSNTSMESITSIARTAIDYSYDGDWGNPQLWDPYNPYDYFSDTFRARKMLSQELRVHSADDFYVHGTDDRWLTGVFLQELAESSSIDQYFEDYIYDTLATDYRARTGAVFGQYESALGKGRSLSLGARFEQRNTRYFDSRDANFSPTFSMLGGVITYQQELDSSSRGYVTLARGYKGGGFNAGVQVPDNRRQYNPEYLWNAEVGLKGRFFEDAVRANISLFHNERRSQQLKFAIQNDPTDPLAFTYITESTGDGRSTGVEVDTAVALTAQIEFFLAGSVMDSQFVSVPLESASLEGRSFSVAPSWQYSTGFRFSLPYDFFSRFEVTGKDAFYFDDSHNQHSAPYSLVNISGGWRHDNWSVIAWTRNIFNERYDTRGFFFGNEPPDYPATLYVQRGDPRTYGITVAYSF